VIEPVRFGDLQDKVVWITGAGKGMGLSMAHAFARQGARLALFDIDAPALAQAKAELGLSDERCLTVVGSVTDYQGVSQTVQTIVQTFGRIDVLINNAGISMNKPSLQVTEQEWLQTVQINLNGVFFCAQAAAKQMMDQGGGNMIFMGSIYGVSTAPNRAAYCATKSAVVALAKSLASEWAAQSIRVNALCPGYVQTPFLTELVARGTLNQSALESRIPLGKLARPEQMAEVALYMASEASSYMTGHAMVVDGGWTADSFKATT
jgi:NAD(P)-dependent dehydrogenase (short-subunit alcohol dehydrogenase family)